jgi:hypothetical protein
MAEGQPTSGLHEPGVALGDGHGQTRPDPSSTTTGVERGPLTGHQVDAGVARPGVGREGQVRIEALNGYGEHGGQR